MTMTIHFDGHGWGIGSYKYTDPDDPSGEVHHGVRQVG